MYVCHCVCVCVHGQEQVCMDGSECGFECVCLCAYLNDWLRMEKCMHIWWHECICISLLTLRQGRHA